MGTRLEISWTSGISAKGILFALPTSPTEVEVFRREKPDEYGTGTDSSQDHGEKR